MKLRRLRLISLSEAPRPETALWMLRNNPACERVQTGLVSPRTPGKDTHGT